MLQPVTKSILERLSVAAILESDDEVVGVAHDDDFAARMPLPPLVDPLVQHVVQVDVDEQG